MTPAKSNFVADVTMLNRIKIAPRRSSPQGLKRKTSLGHRPNSQHTIYHCQAGNSSPFYSLLVPFTPFDLKKHGQQRMTRSNQLLCCHYKQQVLAPSWSHKQSQQKSTGFMVEPQTEPGMRPGTELRIHPKTGLVFR